jgi:hypothetical protein
LRKSRGDAGLRVLVGLMGWGSAQGTIKHNSLQLKKALQDLETLCQQQHLTQITVLSVHKQERKKSESDCHTFSPGAEK